MSIVSENVTLKVVNQSVKMSLLGLKTRNKKPGYPFLRVD